MVNSLVEPDLDSLEALGPLRDIALHLSKQLALDGPDETLGCPIGLLVVCHDLAVLETKLG